MAMMMIAAVVASKSHRKRLHVMARFRAHGTDEFIQQSSAGSHSLRADAVALPRANSISSSWIPRRDET